jgi:hypothetical protein
MKITLPAGVPQWAVNVVRQIERGFVDVVPTSPLRLPVFDRDGPTGLGLPDPTKYTACYIWVRPVNDPSGYAGPAYSDGTDWITTLGTPI